MGVEELLLKLKKSVAIFRDFSDTEMINLLKVANVKKYQQNQVIFKEKDPGDSMYVILSGAVKIHKRFPHGGEQIFASIEGGSYFGEMGMIDGSPRSAQATARVDSLLICIEDSILRSARPALSAKLFRNFAVILSNRLKEANAKVEQLTKKAKGTSEKETRRARKEEKEEKAEGKEEEEKGAEEEEEDDLDDL